MEGEERTLVVVVSGRSDDAGEEVEDDAEIERAGGNRFVPKGRRRPFPLPLLLELLR